MSPPPISIYLPTRNRVALLREAIESVLSQDYRNFELLIVDDASTDDTPNFLSNQSYQDQRLRWVRHSQPRGAPSARNTAIELSMGRFCTGIDDDDVMMPGRLRQLISTYDDSFSLTCTGFIAEDEYGQRRINCRDQLIDLDQLLHMNTIGNQALILRDRLLEVGCFDENMPASQDHDLWVRLVAKFGPARRLGKPSYILRESRDAVGRISNSQHAFRGALRFTEKHRALMKPEHLKSRELVHHYLSGDPLSASIVLRNLSPTTLAFLPAFVTRKYPIVKRLSRIAPLMRRRQSLR
jgi:glycosyltransferase involved in cell wall biosynthesis